VFVTSLTCTGLVVFPCWVGDVVGYCVNLCLFLVPVWYVAGFLVWYQRLLCLLVMCCDVPLCWEGAVSGCCFTGTGAGTSRSVLFARASGVV
jgi:hypothetical protein